MPWAVILAAGAAVWWLARDAGEEEDEDEGEEVSVQQPDASGDFTHPELSSWLRAAQVDFPTWGLYRVSGTRTQAGQDRLYAWGRTVPNPQRNQGAGWYAERPWLEGQSLGELREGRRFLPFGLAVATRDVGSHGRRVDGWSNAIDVGARGPVPADWLSQLGAHAEAHGIVWGGRFRAPDPNHFQRASALWSRLPYWAEGSNA